MKIIDAFLFFNELELLDLRLHTLDSHVDYFVLSEATKTFAGKPKRLYFDENKSAFKRFEGKIIHNIVDNTPDDFSGWESAEPYYTDWNRSYAHKSEGVPAQKLPRTFQREIYQRDSLIEPLLRVAKDEDLIMVSDADEIPNPTVIAPLADTARDGVLYRFCQDWCMYYLNVQCDNEWFGTSACRFSYLKNASIDLVRSHNEDRSKQIGEVVEEGGWHFSFLGGAERVRQKLDAYDYQGRRTTLLLKLLDRIFKRRIHQKLASNEDIFLSRRKFRTVEIDASFPEYLRMNQGRFASLIKH